MLDALLSSSYAHVTCVVPCEAEVACAYDRASSDIILTDDSDMIILTPTGQVMFFREFKFSSKQSLHDTLTGVQYSRVDLLSKLNCNDLLKMAFYMERDRQCGIKDCAKEASKLDFLDDDVKAEYIIFKASYESAEQYSAFGSFIEDRKTYPKLEQQLSRLDARVSELVQQWLSGLDTFDFPITNAWAPSPDVLHRSYNMFLLFLLDDPTRASAWRVSRLVRRLAYSILALYGPTFNMIEHERSGDRIAAVEIDLFKPHGLEDRCLTLDNAIGDVVPTSLNQWHVHYWRVFLLQSVLKSIADSDSAMPARELITQFVDEAPSTYTWSHVHLSAQVEGYYYSLRILQQILSVYLCGDIPMYTKLNIQRFELLHMSLQRMPAIKEVFTRSGAGFTIQGKARRELELSLITIYDRNNNAPSEERDVEPGSQAPRSKNKRKHGKEATSSSVAVSSAKAVTKVPKNMFDLLGSE
jgi:hypothetical protein